MGERPQRPDHFEVPGLTSEVWEIAKMCWHKEPKERPDINTVLQYLNNLMGPGMFPSTPQAIHPHHFHPTPICRESPGVDFNIEITPSFEPTMYCVRKQPY